MTSSHHTFILVATGVFLSTLDSSMINVALPSIMADLNVGLAMIDMVVIVYLMVITCSLLIWGRLADYLNKRRLYVTGMALFSVAALGCTTSLNFTHLILWRTLQGCGAAMMMAIGPALIRDVFKEDSLGRTYGLIGIATSLGLTLGPVLSGILISAFSWKALFFLPLPFTLFMCLAVFTRGEGKQPVASLPFTWENVGLRGALTWALVIIGLVLAFKTVSISPSFAAGCFAVSSVLFLYFIKIERRSKNPLLPLTLLGQRYYRNAVISATLSFCVLFVVIVQTPFYLDLILGYSPIEIGRTMMALPVTLIVFSPLSGWLYDKYGRAWLISTLGLACCGAALILLLQGGADSSLLYIAGSLALLGSGQSLFLTPNSSDVIKAASPQAAGITSGILATARNFGMMGGAAIAGTGFAGVYRSLGGSFLDRNTVDPVIFMLTQKMILGGGLILVIISCYYSLTRR